VIGPSRLTTARRPRQGPLGTHQGLLDAHQCRQGGLLPPALLPPALLPRALLPPFRALLGLRPARGLLGLAQGHRGVGRGRGLLGARPGRGPLGLRRGLLGAHPGRGPLGLRRGWDPLGARRGLLGLRRGPVALVRPRRGAGPPSPGCRLGCRSQRQMRALPP
jgi:hypothetical protein